MRVRTLFCLLISSVLIATAPTITVAQNTSTNVPPIIDVHAHAMDDTSWAQPMCPNTSKFTASDPKGPEAPFGWVQEEYSPKLYPAAKGQYMQEVLAEMERLNVTAVVFGDPAALRRSHAIGDRVAQGSPDVAQEGAGMLGLELVEAPKDLQHRVLHEVQGVGRSARPCRQPAALRNLIRAGRR